MLYPLSVLLITLVSVQSGAEAFDLDYAIEPQETSISGQVISALSDELTHTGLINYENGSLCL